MTTLLQRDTAGFHVEINWLPITETVVLAARRGDATAAVTVAPERARDAFEHPTVYLNDSQVAQLFPRPCTTAPE